MSERREWTKPEVNSFGVQMTECIDASGSSVIKPVKPPIGMEHPKKNSGHHNNVGHHNGRKKKH